MKRPSILPLWHGWISAIQFLTIIPVPGASSHPFEPRRALAMFPLCGLGLGLVAAAIDITAAALWDRAAVSLMIVLLLVMVTGALHLDGVADTADGLYGRRDPEKALAIMKDSRIGAIGAVTMVSCLLLKWVGLWGIEDHRAIWIILVPAYARAAALFGIRFLPYGRPDGTGHSFFQDPLRRTDFWGVGLLIGLSLLAGRQMVVLNLVFVLWVVAMIAYYRHKIHCITGDMLGAMIETTEAVLFFVLSAGGSF